MSSTRKMVKDMSDEDWERYRWDIRKWYLEEKRPVKDLVEEMSKRGHRVTKFHLEKRVKMWRFHRNVKDEEWRYIRHQVEKRKRVGKPTQVSLSGIPLSNEKVAKETERYRDIWRTNGMRSPSPAFPRDSAVLVATPPPSVDMVLSYPPSLPWIRFAPMFDKALPILLQANESRLDEQAILRNIGVSLNLTTEASQGGTELSNIGNVTRFLSFSMPNDPSHETPSCTDILAHGSSDEKLRESLKILIYNISNRLLGISEANVWRGFQSVFEATGLLQHSFLPDFDTGTESYTASSLFHQLYNASIRHLSNITSTVSHDFCLKLVRWLLLRGVDCNQVMAELINCIPQQRNWRQRRLNLRLVKLLLMFKANQNLEKVLAAVLEMKYTDHHGGSSQKDAPGFDQDCDSAVGQESLADEVIGFLLDCMPEGGIFDLNDCLYMCLRNGDMQMSTKLLQRGADLFISRPATGTPFMDYTTSLSAVAEYVPSMHWRQLPIQHITTWLQLNGVDPIVDQTMTAGALISATLNDNHDTIRYLVGIGANVNSRNTRHRTALHAAAFTSTLETCELLLELGADPNCVEAGHMSPLQYACLQCRLMVVQLLISAGANVHHMLDTATTNEWLGFKPFETTVTALGLLFSNLGASWQEDWKERMVAVAPIARLLLGAGAKPTASFNGTSLLSEAIATKHPGMVLCLLRAGVEATWDEILAASTLKPDGEDVNVMDLVLTRKLHLQNEDYPSSVTILLPLAWRNPGWNFNKTIEWGPCCYCSLALLAAVSASLESGDLSTVAFLLGLRQRAKRLEPDVFEGAAVGIAAASDDKGIFNLFAESMPPAQTCALRRQSRGFPGRVLGGALWPWIFKGFVKTSHFLSTLADAILQEKLLGNNSRFLSHILASPLVIPIAARQYDVVTRMMELGYQPDLHCLNVAIWYGREPLIEDIIPSLSRLGYSASRAPDHFSQGPLLIATAAKRPDILRLLLDRGVTNLESSRYVALCEAIARKEQVMVDMLISSGVGIHSPAIFKYQRTPLQQAVMSQRINAIHQLLRSGVDVNQAPALKAGATALQQAAIAGNVGIAKLLLEHGADVNAPACRFAGRTTLEGAAEHGRLDMAQFLLESGFDTTGSGRAAYVKAVAYAKTRGHHAVENLLRNYRQWSILDGAMEKNLLFRGGTLHFKPGFEW